MLAFLSLLGFALSPRVPRTFLSQIHNSHPSKFIRQTTDSRTTTNQITSRFQSLSKIKPRHIKDKLPISLGDTLVRPKRVALRYAWSVWWSPDGFPTTTTFRKQSNRVLHPSLHPTIPTTAISRSNSCISVALSHSLHWNIHKSRHYPLISRTPQWRKVWGVPPDTISRLGTPGPVVSRAGKGA